MDRVFSAIERNPSVTFEVELVQQTFSIVDTNESFSFEIDPYKKMCMLNGYDDLDFLLSLESEIEAFEKQQEIY